LASACQRVPAPIPTSQGFCAEAFVRGKPNIAAPPEPGYIPSAGNTHGGICEFCALWEVQEKEKKKKREKSSCQAEEKNITEGARAQAKLSPELISWMAQLTQPKSTLPGFPAKLFLPPLAGSSAALTPL